MSWPAWHKLKLIAVGLTVLMVAIPPWEMGVTRNGVSASFSDGYNFFFNGHPVASIDWERLIIQVALLWLVVWLLKLTVYRGKTD